MTVYDKLKKVAGYPGTFSKESAAVIAACKELGIKHTYADIRTFILNHV